MNIYEAINNTGTGAQYTAATVISGPDAGKHILTGPDGTIYCDPGSDILSSHTDEICSTVKNNVYNIAGENVFCEKIGVQKELIICGAGHVSMPVIKIGRMTGFEVTVIDDRPEFTENARIAGADHVLCDSFSSALEQVNSDMNTFFVVVTRGHRWDRECLLSIFQKDYAYAGMMASRRRAALLKNDLLASGIPEDRIESLHSPIGLSIGAQTPEEIAVSIMAEIISISRAGAQERAYPDELIRAILDGSRRKILATIVSRKGSAPRTAGTKMLINEDGSCIGTIGGGCAEVYVTAHAKQMMSDDTPAPALIDVDMTADTASDDVMACGGKIRVFLEPV